MIELILEEAGGHRRIEIEGFPIHLGRAEEADVALEGDRCSRHHARIDVTKEGFILSDLESSNGTFRNSERIKQVRIERGDRIELGDAVVTFLGGEVPEPDMAGLGAPEIPGFTFLDDHGEGVLTRVWLARQDALNRKVAVKVLRPEWLDSTSIVQRFLKNARTQSRVHHHGVAAGIDVGEVGGVPYFVTEYLEGDTVGARVRARMALPTGEALRILGEILEAVAHLHRQDLVAANIHPEGVVIGDGGEVWLTSAGFPLPGLDRWPDAAATELSYLAPEVAGDPERAGPRGDVFQVGALAVYMLTGAHPRAVATTADATAALATVPEFESRAVPKSVTAWVTRLIAPDPGGRPADGATALAELEAISGDVAEEKVAMAAGGTAVQEKGDAPRGFRRTRKFILINRAITVVIAIALNVGFFVWWQGRGKRSEEDPPAKTVAQAPGDAANPAGNGSSLVDPPGLAEIFADVSTRVREHLDREEFPQARTVANDFVQRHGATSFASRGVDLLGEVARRRVNRTNELLDLLEGHVRDDRLAEADAVLAEVKPLAASVNAPRLAAAQAALRAARKKETKAADARRAAAEAAARGGAGERGEAESRGEEGGSGRRAPPDRGGSPKPRWKDGLAAALAHPGDADKRRELLARADQDPVPEALAPKMRWVRALESAMGDVVGLLEKQQGTRRKTTLLKGRSIDGILRTVSSAEWTFEVDGQPVTVPVNRIRPTELADLLMEAGPSLDRYLARALFHLLAEDREQAWFDLHAARLLSADDADARELVDAKLKELRKRHGRKQ